MRQFQWPLQRLLDVKAQQERQLKPELVRLTQEIAAAHRKIFHRQAALRGALTDLAARSIEKRLPEQREFMHRSAAEEAQLDRLREELKVLQERRSAKMAAFRNAKSTRETLERLREEALLAHTRAVLKEDQKQLDESSHLGFARKLIEQRVGGQT